MNTRSAETARGSRATPSPAETISVSPCTSRFDAREEVSDVGWVHRRRTLERCHPEIGRGVPAGNPQLGHQPIQGARSGSVSRRRAAPISDRPVSRFATSLGREGGKNAWSDTNWACIKGRTSAAISPAEAHTSSVCSVGDSARLARRALTGSTCSRNLRGHEPHEVATSFHQASQQAT